MRILRRFWDDYKLCFYIMRHPVDGFYSMKHEGKGRMYIAVINFFLLWISFSFNSQYASLIVDTKYPLAMHSLYEGSSIFGILVLWSIANWSVTCLVDGEGKLKEIIMANCYAFTPMILLFIPSTLLSNVLAQGEGAFYTLIIGVSIAFFVMLAFFGMIQVHNFTVGKAIATVFATIVAILIIAFLASLLFTLWQQLLTFVIGIINEIRYRY